MSTRLTPEGLLEASGIAGRGTARSGDVSDAVEGVLPKFVVEPHSAEALAAVLGWSSKEGLSVVLRGNGTKLEWGRRVSGIDLVLSTRCLNRVVAHQHGDLTATIEAGATLADVGRDLARHGQWLPLAGSFAQATVGGTVATNDSGPLRHRHGTPRDLLIGIHLALADGRVVKSGGNVVKNVAGYDLGKLMSGSFGSLAAIVSATFKLAPLPASSSTIVATFRSPEALAGAAASIGASQLEPAAFDVQASSVSGPEGPVNSSVDGLRAVPYRLLIQFASTPAAVAAQIDAARRLLAGGAEGVVDVLTEAREVELWTTHNQRVWAAPGAVVRLSWLPAALLDVLALVDDIIHSPPATIELVARAGVGSGFVRVNGDTRTQVAAIEGFRMRSEVVGNVVVLRAGPEVKEKVDVWGPPRDTTAVLGAIKNALDPQGILRRI
jgi:glycolate dehydrogenase FAD-binding subunit